MKVVLHRLRVALHCVPTARDWNETICLLLLFAVFYLPIGVYLDFLKFEPHLAWQTVLGVMLRAFLMPGLSEEIVFRGMLIPRSTESTQFSRSFAIALSWGLFVLYHLHPFVPPFFRSTAFLIGAGLLGIVCTVSYLRSQSLWTAVVIHWAIVIVWLLVFGGLEKF
ncbi:CPBP family intramembrane metalloprotease [Cyanobacteria bacterium FACHB-63]|nr:CPBP family intramembrane metalloprotease [Cyanobacteria bacterium FACHB-63]